MQVRQLVELGSEIADNGELLLRRQERLPDSALQRYWSASKRRFRQWTLAFAACHGQAHADGCGDADGWGPLWPTVTEVLGSEVLTRVWTAVACEYDRRRQCRHAGAVARHVFHEHLQARRRALCFLVYADELGLAETDSVDLLRRRSERWTDLLLARLVPSCVIADLAFDVSRARDFAADTRAAARGSLAARLMRASLSSAFAPGVTGTSPNPALNRQIAASLLACFRADPLDSSGSFEPLWMARLEYTTADVDALLRMALDSEF
jgi:hypothetical protein